jgi:hypothetical protein
VRHLRRFDGGSGTCERFHRTWTGVSPVNGTFPVSISVKDDPERVEVGALVDGAARLFRER